MQATAPAPRSSIIAHSLQASGDAVGRGQGPPHSSLTGEHKLVSRELAEPVVPLAVTRLVLVREGWPALGVQTGHFGC